MRCLIAVLGLLPVCLTASADSRPNIIVFYTDDHGYADLSCQNVLDDIRTPHVDALAASGVRALHGYSTAPQCVPSRAGLMIGKFQAKFGVESNGKSLDGFNRETTIAQRLQQAGYVTAQFGKWHLGPPPKIPDHGFQYVYAQNSQAPFSANITMDGKDRPMSQLRPEGYHVDSCSQAAASLIRRHKDQPLFLYVAYRAPHVPLDAPVEYLKRFPGKMPERRRQALAMLSAVDDGVGLVVRALAENGLRDRTLIFYIGDNGAPLKIHKFDAPGGGPGWDGSLNDPLNGEKGMLSEGGMHTPFVISWPGRIPAGQNYSHPVSALDVAATATAVADIKTQPGELDGVNLLPFLSGRNQAAPHDALMWRWELQSAIRAGKWNLLRGGHREYLYNLDTDLEEKHNLTAQYPEVATQLRAQLTEWADELSPPGLAKDMPAGSVWGNYFDYYLDGKEPPPLRDKFRPGANTGSLNGFPWIARAGKLSRTTDGIRITPAGTNSKQIPFLARNGLKLNGPVAASAVVKTQGRGAVGFAWRTAEQKDFTSDNRITVPLNESADWQTVETTLPGDIRIIHVRVHVPARVTTIRSLTLKPATGKSVTLEK